MKLRFNNFAFGSLLAGTIIMMVVMFVSGRPLTTAGTPQGILCLEFATSAGEVEQVLHSWKIATSKKTDVIQAARNNTYLDFIFLFFYSFFLAAFCRRLAGVFHLQKTVSRTFFVLSGLALAAGLLDILENIGMLVSLSGQVSDVTALSTAIAATIKWSIVIVIILSIGAGLVYKQFFLKRAAGN